MSIPGGAAAVPQSCSIVVMKSPPVTSDSGWCPAAPCDGGLVVSLGGLHLSELGIQPMSLPWVGACSLLAPRTTGRPFISLRQSGAGR